jgi:hypothetical protein
MFGHLARHACMPIPPDKTKIHHNAMSRRNLFAIHAVLEKLLLFEPGDYPMSKAGSKETPTWAHQPT